MLFTPFDLSGINLKNRVVRSATYEKRADEKEFVTDSLIEFYKELARGGTGLIITGNALVHPSGRSVPQMTGIYKDEFVKGFRRLTDAVHDLGGKIIIQVVHGGRQCIPKLIDDMPPLAPSSVYDPFTKITPKEMTDDEIRHMIDCFGDAARRAKLSGFDGIQIHGAHGYLVSGFLSPHTNRRDDQWGGDEERRFHFLNEVYNSMRSEVGDNYPIMIKMNAEDNIEGGLLPNEALGIAKKLEAVGISAIEVSGGMYESALKTARTKILNKKEEAYYRENSKLFKSELKIPVILVGGIRSKSVAEEILQTGTADLASISRPLIREPDLPSKFMEGKEKADCISCNGCMRFMRLDEIKCVQLEKNVKE